MSLEKKLEGYVDSSVRKKNLLGIIVIGLRKIGFTQFIRKIWIRGIFFKESRKPTIEMKENFSYFEKHRKEVEDNIELLSDEKSKKVYKDIITFRCTHKLSDFPKYNTKNQYFDKELVPIREDYYFADGGAYIGDTLDSFMSFCNNRYSGAVCFEPDPKNIEALRKNINNKENIGVIEKGLWNERTTLHFSLGQTASKISNDGEIKVEVTCMDSEQLCSNVNFIKMDIEGAELKALEGAINIIKTNRPVLTICIYHSNEDMINIIKWVHSLNLNYKLYVRHHSFDINETVLYAIPF